MEKQSGSRRNTIERYIFEPFDPSGEIKLSTDDSTRVFLSLSLFLFRVLFFLSFICNDKKEKKPQKMA